MRPSSCSAGSTAICGSQRAQPRAHAGHHRPGEAGGGCPDEAFLAHLERVERNSRLIWPGSRRGSAGARPGADGPLVAYFSAEFGLTECLPIFAGGLGILAGDHLKSASDLGVPLVGVGLLYQQGYFRQYLNDAGWQQELPDNDFYNLPLEPRRSSRTDGRCGRGARSRARRCWRRSGGRRWAASRCTCSTRTSRGNPGRGPATSPTSSTAATRDAHPAGDRARHRRLPGAGSAGDRARRSAT